MSYCPNCGRKILDESLGCPVCSVRENIDYSQSAREYPKGEAAEQNAPRDGKAAEQGLGCPICSENESKAYFRPTQQAAQDEDIPAEQVTSFTVEDSRGGSQRFESRAQADSSGHYDAEPVADRRIHPILKVFILAAIFIVGTIGQMAGVVAGIVLMKSPMEDYRKFGRVLVIFSVVLLVLSLIGTLLLVALTGNSIFRELLQGL